ALSLDPIGQAHQAAQAQFIEQGVEALARNGGSLGQAGRVPGVRGGLGTGGQNGFQGGDVGGVSFPSAVPVRRNKNRPRAGPVFEYYAYEPSSCRLWSPRRPKRPRSGCRSSSRIHRRRKGWYAPARSSILVP